MAPRGKSAGATAKVWVILLDNEVNSVVPTEAAAKSLVKELGDDASYKATELKGATLNIAEEKSAAKEKAEPKPKAKAAKKVETEEEDDDEEEEEKPAAKKAAPKNPKPANDDIPGNVKELLAATGTSLSGKTIVVTGVPPTLGRKNVEKLVTNYGGKLTKSLSKNTSFVVVGGEAGPVKLEKIEELGLEVLSEDQLVTLLESGGGGGTKRAAGDDEKPKAKKAKK